MGNLVFYTNKRITGEEIHLLVDSCFKFLCDCKFYIGALKDINKLYSNYIRYSFGKSFYCVKSEIKRLSYSTKLEGYEELLFTYFTLKSFTKVNIMEVFAAVIFFAEIHWTDKVKLAFKLFDFDGSKTITEDELFIMFKCFVEGISLTTNGNACSNSMVKEFISTASCEILSVEEYLLYSITNWVKKNPAIYECLNPSSVTVPASNNIVKHPQIKKPGFSSRFSKSFDKQNNISISRRRTNSSAIKRKDENLSVIVDGMPVTKAMTLKIKNIFDKCIQQGNCLGSKLRDELAKENIRNYGKLEMNTTYKNFRDFISRLFHKADLGQVTRILALVNVMTPLPENFRTGRKKNTKMRKIENVFKRFDVNGDGVISLHELTAALKPNFNEDNIQELYREHSRNDSGMHIEEFSEMFLSNNK